MPGLGLRDRILQRAQTARRRCVAGRLFLARLDARCRRRAGRYRHQRDEASPRGTLADGLRRTKLSSDTEILSEIIKGQDPIVTGNIARFQRAH